MTSILTRPHADLSAIANRAPSAASSVKDEPADPEPLTTKVYYYVDDQETPYSVEVPVPPSRVSLADFKLRILGRPCKAYCKNYDEGIGREVKADILNEDAPLKPNAEGRFELFLLSGNAPTASKSNRVSVRGSSDLLQPVVGGYARNNRASAPLHSYLDDSTSQDDSSYFADSNLHVLSDGDDSQSSEFLSSISQQYAADTSSALPPLMPAPSAALTAAARRAHYGGTTRQRRRRQQRRQPRRCQLPVPFQPYHPHHHQSRDYYQPTRRRSYSSFLSSTLDDTEPSMALNLITVKLRLDVATDKKLQFGMSVCAQQYMNSWHIVVHDIAEKSIVALDGRIKVGYIILYVNDVALEDFPPDQAIEFIKSSLIASRQVQFTCVPNEDVVEPPLSLLRLPPEPVRPIDPHAWVEHCNAVNGLKIINEEPERAISPVIRNAGAPYPPTSCAHTQWAAATQSSSAPTSNATVSGSAGEMAGASGVCGPSSGVGSSIASSGRKSPCGAVHAPSAVAAKPFHVAMDKLSLVCAMADPLAGVRLRVGADSPRRSFLGCELLSWLERNVRGLEDERARKDYASNLLREGYILQASRKEFTQQCYYTFNEQLTRKLAGLNTIKRGALTLIQNPAAAHLNSFDELTFSTVAGGGDADASRGDFNSNPRQQGRASRKPGGFRRVLRKFFCFPVGKKNAGGTSTAEYTPVKRKSKKRRAVQLAAATAPTGQCRESTHIP